MIIRMQIYNVYEICGVSFVSLAKFEHLLLNADEKNCISHKITTKIVVGHYTVDDYLDGFFRRSSNVR